MTKKTAMKKIFNKSPIKIKKLAERLNTPVKPLAEQTRAVTPQHWKFIQELCDGDGKKTLVQAALAAGYAESSAAEMSYRLTDPRQSPHVVAAIQRYRQDLAERYGTTFERHMRDMQDIRDRALEAGNYSAAVQAEYRRGQALGTIYVERKEIRHGTIDTMSAEEVRRKLEEIKAMYGDPAKIIDVTPIADELAEDDEDGAVGEDDASDQDIIDDDEGDDEDEGSIIIRQMAEDQRKRAEEERAERRRGQSS